MKILVTGAGGFIGWHLANRLVDEGNDVWAVDIKMPQFKPCKAKHFHILDLRKYPHTLTYFYDNGPFDEVYALAADMGGIGYIENNRAQIMRNNVMINCNTLHSAHKAESKRYLFTSSACVYPLHLQDTDARHAERFSLEGAVRLKEDQAYPAQCEEGYGWEKLYTEMMCQHYREDYGLDTKIARLHNIYGPYGTYEGGREKAPAALCRKVVESKPKHNLEIWGDGRQMRSFCYIDDCIEGLIRIMRSAFAGPFNLGYDKAISIDDLANMIMQIAFKSLKKKHLKNEIANVGVAARNSDNTLIRKKLNWAPSINYAEGLQKTYEWIKAEIEKEKTLC